MDGQLQIGGLRQTLDSSIVTQAENHSTTRYPQNRQTALIFQGSIVSLLVRTNQPAMYGPLHLLTGDIRLRHLGLVQFCAYPASVQRAEWSLTSRVIVG